MKNEIIYYKTIDGGMLWYHALRVNKADPDMLLTVHRGGIIFELVNQKDIPKHVKQDEIHEPAVIKKITKARFMKAFRVTEENYNLFKKSILV